MEVTEAVLTRRSVTRLNDPAPSDDEMVELVQAASTAPDHGSLRPWRLVTIRGEERRCLGEALGRSAGDPGKAERARLKPLRAPLLVSIVFRPRLDHSKVPEWEQLAATASMVHTLHLLLHSRGWGSIWRTGNVDSPWVRDCVGVTALERLLGWLYVGTPSPDARIPPRQLFDVRTRVTSLSRASSTTADSSGAAR
ncbi:nitroreductase [Streptomyces somaliensis DSM 40738]|uniref:nitroreductase family protein n=1 Tax=Streptomyces somaliensis TaxID=78355 RepID=UPI0021C2812A|nr:nitroreductase [Streptomyces somaliensis]MCQ0025072.1 nitroreductase [Streptomyces somaliensis DSM 40738]